MPNMGLEFSQHLDQESHALTAEPASFPWTYFLNIKFILIIFKCYHVSKLFFVMFWIFLSWVRLMSETKAKENKCPYNLEPIDKPLR